MRSALVAIALSLGCLDAHAGLQARDLTGDGVPDAYYDTTQHITWLADADQAKTSHYLVDSNEPVQGWHGDVWWGLPLPAASSWVAQLSIAGIEGWRLPVASGACNLDFLGGCHIDGEMHRLLQELGVGNPGPFINTGGLAEQYGNLLPCWYPAGQCIFVLDFPSGAMAFSDEIIYGMASWAVHDGDVANIPEPSNAALLAAGLLLLGVTKGVVRDRAPAAATSSASSRA